MTLHLDETPGGAQRGEQAPADQPDRHADPRRRELPPRGRVDPLRQARAGQRGAHVQRDEPRPEGIGQGPAAEPAGRLGLGLVAGPAPARPYNAAAGADSYNHCSFWDYTGGWTPGMAPHIIDLPIWALDLGVPTVTDVLRRPLRDQGRRRRPRRPGDPLAVSEPDHALDDELLQQLCLRLRPRLAGAAAGHLLPCR